MRSSLWILHLLPVIGCLGLVLSTLGANDAPPSSAGPGQTAAAGDPARALADARTRAEAALARADLAAYRGWIKFLRYEADTAASRQGAASKETAEKTQRLDDWVARITANPRLLATLSGVQEWAYESPVDGSGQPFKMAIPTDYDPTRPPALSVYMHGYSGNHLEHSTGMSAHPGSFDLAVLGRGRGGGTYRLGSRYPHCWASGRPTCGYASNLPVANLITLPIYATHSDDDWTVSVLHDRGPLARLRELGGQAILDETTGYGHAVWDYKEGN